jgi:hypothetical protein
LQPVQLQSGVSANRQIERRGELTHGRLISTARRWAWEMSAQMAASREERLLRAEAVFVFMSKILLLRSANIKPDSLSVKQISTTTCE